MEALIVGAIIIGILIYNDTIDKKKFMIDNEKYLQALREEDYSICQVWRRSRCRSTLYEKMY